MTWLARFTHFKGPGFKRREQSPQGITAAQMLAVIAPAANNTPPQVNHRCTGLLDDLVILGPNRIGLRFHISWVGGAIGKGVENNHLAITPTRCVTPRLRHGWVIFYLVRG